MVPVLIQVKKETSNPQILPVIGNRLIAYRIADIGVQHLQVQVLLVQIARKQV